MIVRGESTIINYHAPFDQGFRSARLPELQMFVEIYRAQYGAAMLVYSKGHQHGDRKIV